MLGLLLQANMPTNLWTVGGAVGTLALVVTYLFNMYDKSQEKRFGEMREVMSQLRRELDDEKLSTKELRSKFEAVLQSNIVLHQKSVEALDKSNELLPQVMMALTKK